MLYFLGIDIGTGGTKTVLFNQDGAAVSSAVGEYPLYQPKVGWAEQNPSDWWEAVCSTIGQVTKGINTESIAGLGLSGQMHGLVLLDKDYKVLMPSIIWCDSRSYKECDEIEQKVTRSRLIEITANPALTGFTASKLLWVRNNRPEIYEKIHKVLLPKDYIRFMLTGQFATEVSDASGMQLLDVKNRCWSSEMMDMLSLPRDFFAQMYESQEATGTISKWAAEVTGLSEKTVVAGGAGDQAAGAIGNGIVTDGIISSTIGSSGVVFAHTDKPLIDPLGRVHTFCHAVKGKWHVMGVTQGAGLSIKWFKETFCDGLRETAGQMGIDEYVLMDKMAENAPMGAEGLYYLPYLMGERTPHLNPHAKGVFFGMSAAHQKRHFVRAVLEGVVYSLRDCLDCIKELGIEVDTVRASGGGGKSPLMRKMQADVFAAEIQTIEQSEGPALGAAILAQVASGHMTSVPEACDNAIKINSRQSFDVKNHEFYEQSHKTYQKLYESLKNIMSSQ